MAEASLSQDPHRGRAKEGGFIARIAWRNLWRNKRRTWLTAGGIAFASFLVIFSNAMQVGIYGSMIENATGLLEGHIQITHPNYPDDTKLEQTVLGATELVRLLEQVPGIEVAPRAQAYALMSADERSFGGLVVGVDFERENQVVGFFRQIALGRLPVGDEEILLGGTMARNLGVGIGDEVVALGSAKQGGVAAMALRVVGIFNSGQAEIDRSLMFTTLSNVQNAFALGDEVHKLVLRATDPQNLDQVIEHIRRAIGDDWLVRSWEGFMAELKQSIELDTIGGDLVFGSLLIIVCFSVVNTFLMVVFERKREFGMLLAIGMQSGLIVRQVLAEAFFMWVVGVSIGLGIALMLITWLSFEGIPVADMGMEGVDEMASMFYVPDRLYPGMSVSSLVFSPLVLLVGTQVAGLIAMFRIKNIQPVEALRGE